MLSNFIRNDFVASYKNQGARALSIMIPTKSLQWDLTAGLAI
jgi:hypothetical protein